MARRKNFLRASVGRVSDPASSMQGIIENYKAFAAHVNEMVPEVLMEAMGPAFALSAKYCPKDTRALVESGYLQIVSLRNRPTVEIGYGKFGRPEYAAVVHENTVWRHKAPTRAKFLETALKEQDSKIREHVLLRLKGLAK